jgi:hypothetical protein
VTRLEFDTGCAASACIADFKNVGAVDFSAANLSGTGNVQSNGDGTYDVGSTSLRYRRLHGALVANNCADTAVASPLTAENCNVVKITGTGTTVNTIDTCDSANKGRSLTILCGADASVFGDAAGNLQLVGGFTCSTNATLALLCDGTSWREISRSAPG